MPTPSSHDGLHHRELRIQQEALKRLRNAAGRATAAPSFTAATDQLSDAIHREIGIPCAAGLLFDIDRHLYFNLGIPADQKKLVPAIRERAMTELAQLLRCQVGARPCTETITSASVIESTLEVSQFFTVPLVHIHQPFGFLFVVGVPAPRVPLPALVVGAELVAPVLMAIHGSFTHRNTDPLTGLFNQRHLSESLQRTLMLGERTRTPTSLLMLDLNEFKRTNDRHGHPVGDQVLVELARRLRNAVRFSDSVCRCGGDEFAVILPHTDADSAVHLRRRLESVLTQPFSVAGHQISIQVACGIAATDETEAGRSAADLIRQADRAMYQNKPPHPGR